MVFLLKLQYYSSVFGKSSIKSTRIRTPALLSVVGFFKTKRKFHFFTETVEHLFDSKPPPPGNNKTRKPNPQGDKNVPSQISK